MQSTRSGDLLTVAGDYVLDATDLGELLELGAVEHVIGAELLLPRWWHIGRPRLEAGLPCGRSPDSVSMKPQRARHPAVDGAERRAAAALVTDPDLLRHHRPRVGGSARRTAQIGALEALLHPGVRRRTQCPFRRPQMATAAWRSSSARWTHSASATITASSPASLQWAATCNTGHYPFAFDVDGDGHDELAMGYSLYDHDGTLLWSLDDRLQQHVDGVAILDFAATEGAKPHILYAPSDEGLLFLDLDGTIRLHHRIGHAQNPVVARFRDDLPGLQTVSINFWGNQGILNFYDAEGRIYHDAEPLNMGSMCLPINWDGSGIELFVHNPHPTLGGMFDGWGRPVVGFPDDGHPNMCNAVVNLTGDCRDEVVVWNPQEMWIYTQDDGPRTGRLYRPIRNALFNSSNYQVSVSLPGWSE